ncbi:peptide ABC transporter (oligopeptide-binding protein) [Paenibacillus terrae HPL-003]|uniref:Peptide ABC transporter (Oligopeptide-binding protein) n=1 Tax=Paenibacillus terrae (strain HPL-003) TaxID=985665 RepID=G7VU95_PAETH|nr:nickel ABC transporter substrate-binding protein [Paenibacillus terrae]AET60911.1 peptide ABC transporter (oligopeptide-binding protein) [Paenibacillus terrae HPL-003]
MFKLQHFKLFIPAFIAVMMMSACSSSPAASPFLSTANPQDKSITLLFNVQSPSVDPHTDVNYTAVRAGVGETLIKVNQNLKLEPWLAEKWNSKDGQHWTFHIRPGVTFHSGKTVDAAAVKTSLERAQKLNPSVKNALHIHDMNADGLILNITTDKPFPAFVSELVHPNTAVIDTTAVADLPSGTGPFKVASFRASSELNLDRNDQYWNGEVKLKHAKFMFNEDANARELAFQAKNADIVYRPPIESLELLKADSTVKVDSFPSLRTHQLIYNMNNNDLKKTAVRKAFDHLIHRDEIASGIMSGQGTPAQGPFLLDFPFSPKYATKKFDLSTAREGFKQAGYTVQNGKVTTPDGTSLHLTLLTYQSRAELPLISQLIQANAKELGITIDIRQVDNIDEYLAANQDWDLATYSNITAPRGDASYFLNAAYMPEGALNYGRVHLPELEAMITKLNTTVDEEQRNKLALEAVTLIDQENLQSFLVHPNNVVAYRNYVHNWVTSQSEYYLLTQDLDVK